MKRRLDEELVAQGLFATKDEASRAVMAGEVSTSDRRLEHAGEQVEPGIELHVKGRNTYVSRGGLKLEGALDAFGVDPSGLDCLDIGCSSGGFTDCLLRRGAAHVLAVDVGYAQFDWSLRNNERITLLERTNIRDLQGSEYSASIDLAVCDVSFTSVVPLLDAVCDLLREDGRFIVLVKPQFECPREMVGEGGIVRDPAAWDFAIRQVREACIDHGMSVVGVCDSPIEGAKGNREFLLLAQRKDASQGETVGSA